MLSWGRCAKSNCGFILELVLSRGEWAGGRWAVFLIESKINPRKAVLENCLCTHTMGGCKKEDGSKKRGCGSI